MTRDVTCVLLTNSYPSEIFRLTQDTSPAGFHLVAMSSESDEESGFDPTLVEYVVAGGKVPIDRTFLAKFPNIKMIHRSGVGLDNLSLNDIQSRDIALYVEPGINAQAVAEHTVLLLLAVLRQLPVAMAQVQEGNWSRHALGLRSRELSGLTVGIVGFGHIGRHVARLLQGFGCEVLHTSRGVKRDNLSQADGTRQVILDTLLESSDVVTLHLPLSGETRHIMNRARLFSMKKGSVLVNTSRGLLVDEEALYDALKCNHLFGCALDVFGNEPIESDSPLLSLGNFIGTPHVAGLTRQSLIKMLGNAIENIRLFESGLIDRIPAKRLL